MNDPTHDPDDLLRRSLQADAEGVEATDALLDRTLAAASRPPVRAGQRLLVAAAVIAAVAIGAGVALATDDEGSTVESSNGPTTTTSTAPTRDVAAWLPPLVACDDEDLSLDLVVYMAADASVEEIEAVGEAAGQDPRVRATRYLNVQQVADAAIAYQRSSGTGSLSGPPPSDLPSGWFVDVTDPADETDLRATLSDLPGVYGISDVGCLTETGPSQGGRPGLVALVREDGMLMVVDLATGGPRELYTHGDPADDSQEGGPYYVDWAELSPDHEFVYFSTCCEPAVGTTYRIPVTGGEPTMVTQGAYPRVSPDGQYVATSGCQRLFVSPVDGGDSISLEVPECVGSLAWSPDGRQLAATTSTGPGVVPEALLFNWDGSSLTRADTGKPDNPGSFVSWTPDGMLTVSSGGPVDDDRTLSQDGSYGWLLWVDEEGVIREQAGFESSERTPIAELPQALVADW